MNIDWFVSAGSCNPSVFQCNIWSQLQLIHFNQPKNRTLTFEYILHILPLPWSKLFDDIQPINKNRNPVPWKRPWPRQRDRCHGENWEGPCIPGPNQQKTGERCTDIAFFMLFLYLFVFLFICLFVAGSLLILMFHFQDFFSKFPYGWVKITKWNEGAWRWSSEAGLWTGKDVVAGGRFDSSGACGFLGCWGHYLGA